MLEVLSLLPSHWQWLVYFGCAMLIGMSKSGIQNIGTLTVPLFALIFGAKLSTGIVLILLIMADLLAVIYYRKKFIWAEVTKLMPLALVGLITGLLLGLHVDDRAFKVAIGICILVSVSFMFILNKVSESAQSKLISKPWYAPLFGWLLGFSTMIGNAAGPALSVYMLSKRMDKIAFAATSAWFIFILNMVKVPLQLFVWDNIIWNGIFLNLLAIPFIMIGFFLGLKIIDKLPEKSFRGLIQVLVILSSILLIIL